INQVLQDLDNKIADLGPTSYNELDTKLNTIPGLRTDFENNMRLASEKFYDGTYKAPYLVNLPSHTTDYRSGDYVYDLVYNFGKYNAGTNAYESGTFLYQWNLEYSTKSDVTYSFLTNARDSFKDIVDGSSQEISNALKDGAEKLDEITKPFNDANDQIGEILSDTSESIDKNGKRGVKIVFSVLMIMNIALAALLLLICLFSGKYCTSCCCCRCLFKCCTHILWNVLALMMVLSFIVGSLVSLVGRLGGDAMSLVSFIMSKENFNNGDNALLLSELGNAKKYLETCIQGDGDIAQDLNLGSALNSFETINRVESDILSVKNTFTQSMEGPEAYNQIKNQLARQQAQSQDIEMISLIGNSPIKFSELRNKVTSSTTSSADKPIYEELKNKIEFMLTRANSDADRDETNAAGVIYVINGLKQHYGNYLSSYDGIFTTFENKIKQITDLIRDLSGNGENQSFFAFLNGKFIGTNLKIILKYLKHSLGGDFFTVGICLVAVGFSLIISISSTILLIVIINISLKENMDAEKTLNNPNSAISGISHYQMNVASASPKLN
ncbi:MAG: hypothetical protein J6O41_03100, partial [Clostridia bacterium]|nr:hypothetical protein [Clostridia bacterium]